MPGLGIFTLLKCMKTCKDSTTGTTPRLGTKVWNLSDRSVELQIRVGSVLKKVHTLKPGSSKRLKSKTIYKAYMPHGSRSATGQDDSYYYHNNNGKGAKMRYLYYYDETCLPYVWVHDAGGNLSRMVKQQYISLEDLRDCSEIKIFRDHQRGCILALPLGNCRGKTFADLFLLFPFVFVCFVFKHQV